MALHGDVGFAGDDGERMACHIELLSERTHRGVGARGFRGHHHPDAVAGRGHRIRVGIRRFDRAVDATEKIDLVRGLEDVFDQPNGLRWAARELQDLIRHGITAVKPSGNGIGRWIAIGTGCRQYRTGRAKVGVGCDEVAVLFQRLLYQCIEASVIVQAPPLIRRRCGGLGRGMQGHQRRLGARRKRRCVVVGADSARGERACDEGTDDQRSNHGGLDSLRNSGMGEAGPSGAALRNTTITRATAVSTPMAVKQSMIAWVVAADRTTLPSTSSPRATAPTGSMTRVVAAPYALTRWMTSGSPACTCCPIKFDATCSRTRASVDTNAEPISPPMRRATCSTAPKVSASWGRK